MTISEERLLAYADGLLSAEETAEIDRLLVDDPEARALLNALKASDLPYRDAVETLIEVPDLSAIRDTIETHAASARPRYLAGYRALAASVAVFFVIGVLAGHQFFPKSAPEPTQWAVWVDRIASYQALYSRSTLAMGNPPADRIQRQMARVSKEVGARIAAPDLTSLGADFKYARMYALDGLPLAQIAYLPKEGEPFSLCLMKTDKPDHEPTYSTAHGLNVATWRQSGIAYVYVGDTPKDLMDRYIGAMRTQTGA